MDQGLFVSVDFSKAYDSVFHNCLVAFFMYIALPPPRDLTAHVDVSGAPTVHNGARSGPRWQCKWQTPETWKEWKRLRLPDEDLTFMQQALWCKHPLLC